MQQLLQCLITQKRLPRTKAALGLLMNCPESSSNISTTPASSIDVTISSNDPTNSHSAAHCSPTTTRAEQIVQRHLLGFLSPKDLNSDELQLPLLAALAQAAVAGGWGPEGAAEPTAVLLVACSPTVRGLETLLNVVQVSGLLTMLLLQVVCVITSPDPTLGFSFAVANAVRWFFVHVEVDVSILHIIVCVWFLLQQQRVCS